MDTRQRIDLQNTWWQRTNDRPLVTTYAPVKTPHGGFDVDVAPTEIVKRKVGNLQAESVVPSDGLPAASVNFGTAFMPALAGAKFEYDGVTAWAHPCADSVDSLTVQPFDPDHPLWKQYIERFVPLLDSWSLDTFVPGIGATMGPLDVLAGLLGPEALAMDMLTSPDAVRAAADDCATLCIAVVDALIDMVRDAGFNDGTVDWMRTWLPGRGMCFSEDYAALCGEQHFRDFFLAPDGRFATHFDTPYLHLHSGAVACLPAVLDMPNLKALELSNDPNGPDLPRYIAAAQRVQAAGKPLQVSNWQKPLTLEQIDRMLGELDPHGLKITLQAQSLDEANALYDRVKG